MIFTGETERAIDDKHRISVPAEMRAGFPSGVLYAAPGANEAIWLWPEETFELKAGTLAQSLLPDEDVMEFEQILFSQSRRIEIDKAGRIRLPEALLSMAQICHQAVVLGVNDHLEIVDAAAWQTIREKNLPNIPGILGATKRRTSE